MLFWWGCQSFHFLIYNINSTSYTTISYYNLFLFTTASFHFIIYNINVTFSPTLTYFNIFHFTSASFYFLIYIISITLSPTLTHSNLFLSTTDFFTPMWYVRIKIWIVGGTFCPTRASCLIHKTVFFRRLRCTFLYFVSDK